MEKKSLVITVIAVLAIIGAAVRLLISQSDGASKLNLKPFEHLGAVAGEQTAKLVNNQGTVIAVVEEIEGMKSPNNEALIKGFKAGLARSKGVTLKEVKELKRDMSGDPREWPAGRAAQVASIGGGASAVVLFVNFPQAMLPPDVAALKGSKAKILMVGTQSPLVNTLVTSGVIQVAIVARTPPPPAPSGTETPGQWFARVYTELKAP